MRKTLLFVAFVAVASFMSCDIGGQRVDGNGNLTSQNRNVGEFTKIKVTGAIDVFAEPGTAAVKVEGDENILQYVETEISNGWLEIKTKEHFNINSRNPVKVYVTAATLSGLSVTGSGNITCDKKFNSNGNMSFSVTGSGNIRANINAPAVDAHITGSGNIYIKGETRNADIHVTGSGNFDSPDLKSEKATVNISGSGNANLFADANLNATIAGSGDVKYRGNAVAEKHIAGSGSVVKVE